MPFGRHFQDRIHWLTRDLLGQVSQDIGNLSYIWQSYYFEIFACGTESINLVFSPSSWETFENMKMLLRFSTVKEFSVYYAKLHQFGNLDL
jgi:hypothetical protein